MKIRIKFKKSGVMKFIGHLDVMRYFQKAIRRADIDIKYSTGYSPHQIMSFASPLGVGITSDGEYVDIEVNSTMSSKEAIAALNAVNVAGIEVVSYRQLAEDTKNAMSVVAACDYTVRFREGYALDGWQEKVKEFLQADSILIVKKTKKSEKEIDLKPFIYQYEVREDEVFFQLCAGSVNNIKPELVMEAFYKSMGLELPEFALLIHRNEMYAQGEKEGSFIALDELGDEIV